MTATITRPAARTDATAQELVRFFVLAFVLSWALGGIGFLVLDLGLVGLAMGTASVTVAALILTHRGAGSMRPLVDQVLRWRVGLRWYAAAVGLPLIAIAAAVTLAPALGADGLAPEAVGIGLAVLWLPVQFAIGGLEEPGWRGYALPRLQRHRSALAATLILGVIWMLWHVPLFVIPNPMFDSIPFAGYVVVGVSSAVVYTWIYNSTGGSVLLVMLLHAVKNTTLGWLAPTSTAWAIFASAWVVLAIAVVTMFGARHLASRSRHLGFADQPS